MQYAVLSAHGYGCETVSMTLYMAKQNMLLHRAKLKTTLDRRNVLHYGIKERILSHIEVNMIYFFAAFMRYLSD